MKPIFYSLNIKLISIIILSEFVKIEATNNGTFNVTCPGANPIKNFTAIIYRFL